MYLYLMRPALNYITHLKIRDNRHIGHSNIINGDREDLGAIDKTSRRSGTALVQSKDLAGVSVGQQLVSVVILNLEVGSIIGLNLGREVIGIGINRTSNASAIVNAGLLSRSQHGGSQDYSTDKCLVEFGVDRLAKEVYRHCLARLFTRSVLLDRRDMRTHYFYRVKWSMCTEIQVIYSQNRRYTSATTS